jgi:uncharacterized protein (TIRG00374 family)
VTLRRLWPTIRFVLGLGVLALAVWVVTSHSNELTGISDVFSHLNWWWIAPAIVVEMFSFGCFTGMEYELLQAGGLRAPTWPLVEMTFASQAMTNSLPAGTVAGSVYAFRWFRRFGADAKLSTWSLMGTIVASATSLALFATIGLALATSEGASLDLVPVIIGVLLVSVAVGVLFVYERPLAMVVTWALQASRATVGRPRGDVVEQIERIVSWATMVRLGWRQIIRIVLWGGGNWTLDCACFAMMFLAVHASIPWKGLLLAYGAGQLAATLPITPGGLGAVEGSITIALVAFGGARVTTVDAVLMYRIISFWLILVIGWGMWGRLALGVRRGRWSRELPPSTVEGEDSADSDDPFVSATATSDVAAPAEVQQ